MKYRTQLKTKLYLMKAVLNVPNESQYSHLNSRIFEVKEIVGENNFDKLVFCLDLRGVNTDFTEDELIIVGLQSEERKQKLKTKFPKESETKEMQKLYMLRRLMQRKGVPLFSERIKL